MASSSTNTVLSLFEKYKQLNELVDKARTERSSIQKQVQDIRHRLADYHTQHRPALHRATEKARREIERYKIQGDTALEKLECLQTQRDQLVKSRDALYQDNLARQEKYRLECRNFLIESQAFQKRECPQLHWRLLEMQKTASSFKSNQSDDSKKIHKEQQRQVSLSRLWAIALATGWDTQGLPPDVPLQVPGSRDGNLGSSSSFEELDLQAEDINWELCDAAFVVEEGIDDDEIRRLIVTYQHERKLYDAAQQKLQTEQSYLQKDVEDKYQTTLRCKTQLESKLHRLAKEVQQLEVDLATMSTAQDMAQLSPAEGVSATSTPTTTMTTTSVPMVTAEPPTPHHDNRPRVSISPTDPTTASTANLVVNPYTQQRRLGKASSSSSQTKRKIHPSGDGGKVNQPTLRTAHQVPRSVLLPSNRAPTNSTTSTTTTPATRRLPGYGRSATTYRPGWESSRKRRKSAFGSSMAIGGAEIVLGRQALPQQTLGSTDMVGTTTGDTDNDDDDEEDADLLGFTPFRSS